MTRRTQLLFIQGGGAGAHDRWDAELVESLTRELGDAYQVRYPRMPNEDDPSYPRWRAAIERELLALSDCAVVVGHSVGATILVNTLAEIPLRSKLGMVVLLAAPFVGSGGWPGTDFELPGDLGDRLGPGVPVHVFHGLEDVTVDPSHADLYAKTISHAHPHRLPGRDHQFNDELSEVADVIRRRPS